MKNFLTLSNFLLIAFLVIFLVSCDRDSTQPETGVVKVRVVDMTPDGPPVPDVEITLIPVGLKKKTDTNGEAIFHVQVGDYFVDANVCCVGPAYRHYHVPVTVLANDTTTVTLLACSVCV